MTDLVLSHVSACIGDHRLVDGVSLTVRPGELVALLGPNGAGKTTLLRAGLGLLPRSAGTVTLGSDPIETLTPALRARKIAYLPQARPMAWPVRVRDAVALGRFAHGAGLGRLADTDAAAVERAMAACNLTDLADRAVTTLSGGERARADCARAFASEAPLLVADEPIAALDPYHQHSVMALIAQHVASGRGALVVLHDVSLAARFATRLAWMKNGGLLADGPVEDTLTPDRVAEIYGMAATISGRAVTFDAPL